MTGSTPEALNGSVADFRDCGERNLLDRWLPHQQWWNARLAAGLDPYCKAVLDRPGPTARCAYRDGTVFAGVNFASQDYLSLSAHPAVLAAAADAAARYGVHSAGSASLMGNTALSWRLERALADFLGMADCTLFSTGWGAGYGLIRTLVSSSDHVVLDVLAHACLYEGAYAATRKVHRAAHLSLDSIGRRLKRIRVGGAGRRNTGHHRSAVFHGFRFPRHWGHPGALPALRRDSDARRRARSRRAWTERPGSHGSPGVLGAVDLVMGSFSKCFATNGGFVATNHPALKLALRSSGPTQTFTNAIGPVSAAIAEACLQIVQGSEGATRRARLAENALHLRAGLADSGFTLLGQPSAIIPVVLGEVAAARQMTAHAIESGALVNLVEFPAVSRNSSRWRLQVMADHEPWHIDRLVEVAKAGRSES